MLDAQHCDCGCFYPKFIRVQWTEELERSMHRFNARAVTVISCRIVFFVLTVTAVAYA
jgi:hypothetical protein